MTEYQMERVLMGAALVSKDGCLYAYDGKGNGCLVFKQVDSGRSWAVTEKELYAADLAVV